MYYLCGQRQNFETVVYLCGKAGTIHGKPDSLTDLKKALSLFLQKVQPDIPGWIPDPSDEKWGPAWIKDENVRGDLIRHFQNKSTLNDRRQSEVFMGAVANMPDAEEVYSSLKVALESVERLDSGVATLIRLCVNSIFHSPSHLAGGGSTSAAIGVIWANPRSHWTLGDRIEFLVHETTHQLMFLDELRYRHYASYSELSKEENYALSAILKKPRPLDKVIHSLVVATEVLLLRERLLGHPKTPRLHPTSPMIEEQCRKTIDSLLELFSSRPDLVTARARSLLELCANALEGMKTRKEENHEFENLVLAN